MHNSDLTKFMFTLKIGTAVFQHFNPNKGGYITVTHDIHKTLQCFGCILLTYVNNVCLIHLTTINHKRCFSNPTVLDSVVPRLTDWLLNHCQTLTHPVSPQNNQHGAIGPQAHTFWLGDSHSLFYQS